MTETISVKIARQDGFRFLVDFGNGSPNLVADEPPPIGAGSGPSPERLLAAAIANCLCGSLLFSLHKYRADPGHMTASATCEVGRNENNRLRVQHVAVDIALGAAPETLPHLDLALAHFQEFCTVTESVRAGIPYAVSIHPTDGSLMIAELPQSSEPAL